MEKLVKDFNEKYMKPLSHDIRMLDIQSEIGELAKEVVKSEDYGKADFKITEDLKMELGDAIYSLLSFAIENGIDPKEVLKSAIEKYENRMIKKGHIGSNQ